ncbi:MAG: PIN domain-containing protein [Armatimonadetes bacterium]|nr:PIN domain-containing protein [Armatimonadota bacterium]MDW8029490.1 PIN domain-containing protein [Armatimonadota bacterium]
MIVSGCDKGFLVNLDKNHPTAIVAEQEAIQGQRLLVIPTVVLAEFARIAYRYGKGKQAEQFAMRLTLVPWVRIVLIDTNIALRSARLAHGLGLPILDALILAACLESGCDEFWTTDRQHFAVAEQQGIVKVVWL